MCGFVNVLLKLNIYVLSSKFSNFRYLKNDISSFSFKSFKNWNILFAYGFVVKIEFKEVVKYLFHA